MVTLALDFFALGGIMIEYYSGSDCGIGMMNNTALFNYWSTPYAAG